MRGTDVLRGSACSHRGCPQASLPAGPCITDYQGAGAIGDLAWSPTGRTLAVRVVVPGYPLCTAPPDANYLLDLPDGHPRQFGYGLLGPLRFSSDGRFVASASWSCIQGGSVSVARADSGERTGGVWGLFEDWAPRGLRLLYDRGKRVDQENPYPTLYPATMDPFGRHRWTLRRIPETAPTWSPSGNRIAFFRLSGRRQGLYVAHVGRHDARRLRGFVYDVRRSTWSPNGRWIFGGAEGTYFVRSDGAGLQRLSGALLSPDSPLIWAPDSSHLAFVDSDGVVRVVSLSARTGGRGDDGVERSRRLPGGDRPPGVPDRMGGRPLGLREPWSLDEARRRTAWPRAK